ncbi:energy transducer TonB [Shewanella sp. 10N.286.45.A1]|uniref:energy transducer TonB n=1 Tax=Shewanella sp. 10N.286.45.A1 TaxID=3229694 RepID=UPI00354BBAE3
MYITWPTHKNAFLLCLFLPLWLAGCSSNIIQQQSPRILQLESKDFASYWVVKDKLIDWRKALPNGLHNDPKENTTQYKASFVVNSHGQMTQLEIINSVTGELLDQAALAEISNQQFYPTAQNSALQAVRINTSFRL